MADILLVTLNARYSHASLGLRCLRANLRDLRDRSAIREFTINDPSAQVVETLLAEEPAVLCLGIYIWNLRESERLVSMLKALRPELPVVIGGPEVSHGTEHTSLGRLATVVVEGEGDAVIHGICADLLAGRPVPALVQGGKPDLAEIALPYNEYTDEDLSRRIIYVEASRGCPFTCEFCLSSIDSGVREVEAERFLAAMDGLIQRGCRTFKFVDRTFNLKPSSCERILGFFLDRWQRDALGALVPPMTSRQMDQGSRRNEAFFLHFEMVPDRLPERVKELVLQFPVGAIQFEVGIQSFTEAVGINIKRRMDATRTEANLAWLRDSGLVHVHADLIVGLPGETLETFAATYNRLHDLRPGEIQVGILKLLRGTPLLRHREPYAMVFNPEPPYDLLASRDFPFALMQRCKRFARYHEIFVNSGRFPRGLTLLIERNPLPGPFAALMAFADRLWECTGQEHALAKTRQFMLLLDALLDLGVDEDEATAALAADFLEGDSERGLPERLRPTADAMRRQSR